MNKILIALHNRKLQAIFREWVEEEGDRELLLLAKNAQEAIKMVKNNRVAIVVTELMSLNANDGFDLLAFLNSNAPETQICTIVNTEVSEIEFETTHINSLKMFKKPRRLQDVVTIMARLAENYFDISPVADISLAEIFKLIEIEKKLCVLEVSSPLVRKKGQLYFEHGVLFDAFWGSLEGEEAVLEMMSWREFAFDFKPLPLQTPKRNIEKSLDVLITPAD